MNTQDAGKNLLALGYVANRFEMAERIGSYIERCAGGRIQDLRVECDDLGSVTLRGRSRTYHAKQLAQQAAFDCLRGGPLSLDNAIVVC